MTFKTICNYLDRISFLGLRIWEFGCRSLAQEYGWFFLFKIAIKYPAKTFRGLMIYRHFCRSLGTISPNKIYSNCSIQSIAYQLQRDPKRLLVGMGYCQRPIKTDVQPLACPSPRFSHNCSFIEHPGHNQLLPACKICDIQPIAEAAIQSGAAVYIMTSAKDIAREIFLPTLAHGKYRAAILFICPYSILPIALPLMICDIQFLIVPYAIGDCRNYSDFLHADQGIKPKRTFPMRHKFELVLNIFNAPKNKK
ncbi:MAG: hypothetical protein ONB31_13835 [candidate division KSB1 bacterium]|nr:hypothetical protein [candidate division KSB1 bacterium]MDZ7336666.1 hypothetical protein [candidate division KSB1 bacterium]MDZ7402317.1 hypothetical protein [candidate division KSB1 bacterium]